MEERKKTVMEVTEEEILSGDGSDSKVSSEEEGGNTGESVKQ